MKTPPSVHRRTLRRNGPSARRLEPRMMFDGAAVVDATAAVNDAPTAEHSEAAAAPAPVVDPQTATSQATQPAQTPTETAPSDASTQTSTASGAAPTSDTGTTQLGAAQPSGAQPGEAEGNSSTAVAPATGQQSATSSDTTVRQTAEPDAGSQSETMRQEASLANAAAVASDDAAHLSAVEEQAKQAIASFLGSADGLDKLAALFPGAQTTPSPDWMARAETLRSQVLNGSFNLTVQFVDGAAMGGYYAAFAASGPNGTPTILVNHDWWSAQTDDGTRVRALVEEYGHAIDNRLNPGSDTAGDEGEAFSDKVLNISVNYVDEARIAVENDHKTVVVDGLSYEVETATLSFLTAYKVYTGAGFLAEKEQNRHHFIDASLGVTVITDGQLSSYFSGNDVVAKVSLNGSEYYGWVSRPIKDQGIVRGFYFWYDANFGNLSTATQDGNMDGDRSPADNNAFILVVDQNYFNNLSVAGSFTDNGVTKTYKFVGSSSDRVDTALNSLVVPNRAPTPSNDSLTILEDSGAGTGNVLTNDSDADGNALAVTGFSINGSAGTLGQAFTIANVGQFTLSADGSYSFTPAANYAGPVPTITYTVSDGQVSATATLSIAITPVNDAPGGTDKTITMDEDTSHTFSAGEFGFTDASDNPANSLQSVVITTLPSAGTLTLSGTAVIAGQEILATDLTKLKFTPATDAFGASYATFTFQVRDSGGTANGGINLDPTPNTITFTVNNVNDAPTASADTATAVEAGGLNNSTAGTNPTGNVLTNDTDPDSGDTKAVSAVSFNGTSGTLGQAVNGAYGKLTLNADGSYEYQVDNTNAAVQALRSTTDTLTETFTYTMRDAAGLTSTATLTITVRGANDNPIGVNDYNIAKETTTGTGAITGFTATGNVLTNDTDPDKYGETKAVVGMYADATGVTLGSSSTTLGFTLSNGSSSVSQSDYIWLRTGGAGTSQNPYTWSALLDGSGNQVRVSTINTTASTLTFTTEPSSTLANGSIIGFTSGSTLPQNTNGLKNATVTSSTVSVAQSNSVTVSGVSGTIVVGMTMSGHDSTNTDFTAVVTAVSGNTVTFNGAARSITSTNLAFTAVAGTTLTGKHGSVVINADGSYTYTPTTDNPNLSAGDSYNETFTYRMRDAAGVTSSATLTITVLGSGSNDPTASVDAAISVEAGGVANGTAGTNPSGNVLTNDTTPSGTSGLSLTDARSSTTSTNTAVGSNTQIVGSYGTLTISSNGSYSYALDNSNSTVNALRTTTDKLTDVFIYRIANSQGGQSYSTLTITIDGANDAPVAVADAAIAREASGYGNALPGVNPTGNVLINDSDVDAGDTKAVNAIEAGGSLTGSASTVTTGTTSANGTAVTGSYGSLTVGADGSYVYTVDNSNASVQALALGQTLTDSFTYRAVDANGATSTATLIVTIQGANDAPTNAVPSSGITVAESSSVALSGISVADVDDASLTVQLTVQNGTLTVGNLNGALVSSGTNGGATLTLTGTKAQLNSALGTLSYQGAADYSGIDLLTVQTTDSAGLVALSTVDVTVTADSRALTVTGSTVNETSPYLLFKVDGTTGQKVTLALQSTGTGSGDATIGADLSPNLEYFNGTAWTAYTGGTITIPTGNVLLVRTAVYGDSLYEGGETVKLVASNKAGTNYNGTGTIIDDGTGAIYLSTNTSFTADTTGIAQYPDDDRPLTVNSISVNEASPYAVFTVSGNANQVVRLSLTDGTATSPADYGTGLQYYNGTAWVSYTAGSDVTMTGSTLLVRTSIVNDSTYEGQEAFLLGVTKLSSGTTVYGTASIYDDGTGSVYLGTNTTGTANVGTDTGYPSALDDDRTVSVSSPTVNEGSDYAIFTLTGNSGQTVTLTLENVSASINTSQTLKVWDGLDWVDYTTTGALPTFDANGKILVRVDIRAEQDAVYEGAETFKLKATLTGQTAAAEGTATIKDDGTGSVYLSTNTTGTANASTDTGYPSYLDDDRAVTVNSISVNEASPYAVFTVSGNTNQVVKLSLTDGTATNTADFGTGLEYYNGTAWVSYTAGSDVTMTGSTLLVRTSIVNDSTYEGSETFKLVVTRSSSSTTAEGTATIKDDGTGSVYLSTNTTGTANASTDTGYPSYLDDDRAVTVNSISVNEASPYAVFTVSGNTNQVVKLSLTDGTATNTADFGTGLEYYNGTAWVSYTAGSDVTMTGSTLLVRTSIVNDSTYEGAETFKLVVTRSSSSTTAEGTATIKDDGTGSVYVGTNTTGTANTSTDTGYPAQLDDDRPTIAHVGNGTVNSITVTEGQSAVFSVVLSNASSATETFVLGLAGATATSVTDFRTAPTFSDGVTYDATAGTISVPAGVTRFTVTISTVDDGDVEASETFTLTIGASTGTATITDNDVAPTPPTVVVTPPVTPTVPEPPTIPVTPVVPVTPVTPTVPEVVTTPVTPTLPEVVPTPVTPTVPQTTPAPVVVTEVPALATPVVQSTPAPTPVALTSVVTPQPSAGFAPLVDPAIVPAEIGSANALPSRPDDAVRQNPQYELRVDKPIPDVLIPTGTGSIAYILPVDAFKHTDPNARVEMSAALIDGRPLPSWLKFDPIKGAFTGTPPEGYRGDLQVKVVARDGVGRQAETMVHLKVGDVPQRQTQLLGKPGLAQQLKGHGLHAWKADRERLIHQSREASLASRMSKSAGRLA